MAEWPKAHDWKSCIPLKGIEGANPSLSANNKKARLLTGFFVILTDKGFELEKEGSTRTRGGWKYAGEAQPSEDAAAKRQRSQFLSIHKKENTTFYVWGYFTD